jgi:hypothetical protein
MNLLDKSLELLVGQKVQEPNRKIFALLSLMMEAVSRIYKSLLIKRLQGLKMLPKQTSELLLYSRVL